MGTAEKQSVGRVRVKRAERRQVEWRPWALDQLLASDHRARSVWMYVDSLDLSPLYAEIRAVEGQAGRDAVDPKILMALWMLATIEGISSARQLDRLCERDLAYMWICGGVGVNYHLLSDFRKDHGEFLDQLLTDTIATLIHQGVVTLELVAQDGMRVRASAGASSFRREPTLQECHEQAREQVQRLRDESDDETQHDASNKRRDAARLRAAQDRQKRVEQALEELAKLQQHKAEQQTGSGAQARCSMTDPEARKMKMPDGGYRPAYNVQFGTDGGARVIVSVDVTNSGSDRGQMAPLHDDIVTRYGHTPQHYAVDGGFATKEDITTVEQRGSQILAPIHGEARMRSKGQDPYARQRRDTDEAFAFRQRMAQPDAKEKYKQRSSIAEFPNAECRNRGLQQFRVRGLAKVKAVALWYALAFNFLRMTHLGCLPQPG